MRFAALGSGSRGNATLVEAGSTRVLIDCGLSRRELYQRLESLDEDPTSVAAVLLTHEHGDHAGSARAVLDLASSAISPIAHSPRSERDPMWIGDTIYFASDRDRILNIYAYRPGDGGIEAVTETFPLSEVNAALDHLREGKARYAKRKSTVETVFGIIKHVLGFRQFLLRGLDAVQERPTGNLAAFRLFELAAFVNRVRSLRVRRPGESPGTG